MMRPAAAWLCGAWLDCWRFLLLSGVAGVCVFLILTGAALAVAFWFTMLTVAIAVAGAPLWIWLWLF